MTLDPEARAVLERLAAEQRAHAEAERQADAEIAAGIAAENARAIEAEAAYEAYWNPEADAQLEL